jgi:hypothetical protein
MKLKLAIIYGILIWIITYLATWIMLKIFSNSLLSLNITIPIIFIIVTGFFGILYIRNINGNEVIEGLIGGVIFILVDVIFDFSFSIISKTPNIMYTDYEFHVFSIIVITLLITTFLGYLAQMSIDLK